MLCKFKAKIIICHMFDILTSKLIRHATLNLKMTPTFGAELRRQFHQKQLFNEEFFDSHCKMTKYSLERSYETLEKGLLLPCEACNRHELTWKVPMKQQQLNS